MPKEEFVSSAGLLDIEDVGEELNVPPIAVLRLIARRAFPATAVGNNVWRIADDDVKAYVKKGAPDVSTGVLDKFGGWFDDRNYRYRADGFSRKILAACADQELTDADIVKRYRADPSTLMLTVALKTTPEVMAVVNGPAPPLPAAFATGREKEFDTFGLLWAAVQLWNLSAKVVSNRPTMDSPVAKLYKDPATYDAITKQAGEMLARVPIFRVDMRTVEVEEKSVGQTILVKKQFSVRYELLAGTFATGDWLTRAINAAF
jgi:hypothetical protein